MKSKNFSEPPYPLALLVFTAATGAADGVSFVALDKVFTGNMTGNVLFIGFGLVGVQDIPVINNLVALLCFLSGAVLGARITRGPAGDDRLRASSVVVTAGNTVVMFLLAALWFAVGTFERPFQLIVAGILALLLGAQAAAIRHAGLRDLTTVVITMTMVSLSSDSRLAGGTGPAWLRRFGAIIAMGLGALISAALAVHVGGAAALLAAATIMGAGVLALWHARRVDLRQQTLPLPSQAPSAADDGPA